MAEKPKGAPIQNEADNGLKNLRGTLAMARTGEPHSASSQFFINVADNAFLNHRGKSVEGWGYAVFGQVVDGMDVVDAIVAVPRGNRGPHGDVPVEPIVMKRVTLLPDAQPSPEPCIQTAAARADRAAGHRARPDGRCAARRPRTGAADPHRAARRRASRPRSPAAACWRWRAR